MGRRHTCTGHRPWFTGRFPAITTATRMAIGPGGGVRTGEATDMAMAAIVVGINTSITVETQSSETVSGLAREIPCRHDESDAPYG